MGSARLGLVALAILSLWIARNESELFLILIGIAYLIPFALLMWLHNKWDRRRQYAETMIQLNEDELKALDYDFSAFDGASEKSSSEHAFSLDLDVFGDHSLFQSINRTVTVSGKEKLADWFLHPLTDRQEILRRQEAIKELADLSSLRQHFYVIGHTCSANKRQDDLSALEKLSQQTPIFSNHLIWKVLINLIPFLWILLGIAYGLGWIGGLILNIYFLIVLVVAYARTGATTSLHTAVNKMESIFSGYSKLINCIEREVFQSLEIKNIQERLNNEKRSASQSIKQLSSYIGGLDQRFSLAGIICNILYLRDIRKSISLERWVQAHANDFPIWFDSLSRFDALSSLGGFAFNHPDTVYPTITDTYFLMEGKALAHPLLNRNVCVRNDINIHKNPWFLIITGANMAGKSTYLRTIGVNYLLACVGAPVCARSLTVSPAKLVTSLRTSDSLTGNESYFFAELKRLKMIIDRLRNGEQLFIILDEILKGTNSIDKQKGSIALMRQLISYKACGIIATHDLVLGTLAEEFPEQVKNFHFDADINNEELSFSYQLREGIAQNMNACFLMRKMGITIS